MKISSFTQTVVCSYILTGDGQYLTDHHNRENEILICSQPLRSRKHIIDSLISSAYDSNRLPNWISDKEMIDAIVCMVDRLTTEDCYPSCYRELKKTDFDAWLECDINIYAYLSW